MVKFISLTNTCAMQLVIILGPHCGSTAPASADAGTAVPRDVLPKLVTLACVASSGISLTSPQVCFHIYHLISVRVEALIINRDPNQHHLILAFVYKCIEVCF